MDSEDEPGEFSVSATRSFKNSIKSLGKRYRRIKSDVKPIIDQIRIGQLPGNRVVNIGSDPSGVPYAVFKVRIINSDNHKGISAGYRLIYEATIPLQATLIAIYSKSDQSTLTSSEILALIRKQQEDSTEY